MRTATTGHVTLLTSSNPSDAYAHRSQSSRIRRLRDCLLLILGVTACSLASPVAAQIVTVPAGLNPGDQYRLIFVTDGTKDATSNEIADYNLFVTNEAATAPALSALGTNWFAVASTNQDSPVPDVYARDNTGTDPSSDGVGFPVFNLSGTLIASSNADLWDGELQAPIEFTQSGNVSPFSQVWTGTLSDGRSGLALGGGPTAMYGNPSAIDSQWVNSATFLIDNFFPLYALSDPITVVPEPSTVLLIGLALLGSLTCRNRLA